MSFLFGWKEGRGFFLSPLSFWLGGRFDWSDEDISYMLVEDDLTIFFVVTILVHVFGDLSSC